MAPREEPASILQTPEGFATACGPTRSDVPAKHGRIAEAEIARASRLVRRIRLVAYGARLESVLG